MENVNCWKFSLIKACYSFTIVDSTPEAHPKHIDECFLLHKRKKRPENTWIMCKYICRIVKCTPCYFGVPDGWKREF